MTTAPQKGIATRWRVLALLFFARMALGVQFQTLASVGDDLILVFGLDYAGVGLLIGLFMAPGLVLAIPAGLLGRLVADREMVVLGLGALAVGGLVSSLAGGSTMVGAGRVIAGAGFLFTTVYFTKMVADWFDGREIATAMSVLVMSWPVGIAIGQVGHVWLADLFGWRVPFQAASAYCVIMALAVWAFYRAPRAETAAASGPALRLTGQEWRLVICAGAAWGLFNAGYVTFLTYGPKVLEGAGLTPLAGAGVISVGSWVMIASFVICGQIVDRYGRRDLVVTVCMVGGVLALWLLGQPGAGLWGSLLFGLVGMAPAGVIMALSGQSMRAEARAFGMGVFFTVYYIFMMATPPLAGVIADMTGRPDGPIWLGMALCASVVPFTLAFRYVKANTPISTRKEHAQ